MKENITWILIGWDVTNKVAPSTASVRIVTATMAGRPLQ